MTTVILLAIIGAICGVPIDRLIAHFSREWYEEPDIREDDEATAPLDATDAAADDVASGAPDPREAWPAPRSSMAAVPMRSAGETGSLSLPWGLTDGANFRTVLVIAVTAAVFGLIGLQYEGHIWEMSVVAIYASAMLICTGTDLLATRVPNKVSYPAILLALLVAAVAPGETDRTLVVIGGVLTGGVFLLMYILTRGGMGLGDVKLAFFVGFALGLQFGVRSMLLTAVAGGLVAGVLVVLRLRGRRDGIPYAPFIAGGAVVIMLLQGTAFRSL